MFEILTVISPLFLIIFASALIRKFTNIGDNWENALNQFALKIGLPSLLFTTIATASFSFKNEAPLIVSNSIFLLTCFLLAIISGKILRLKREMFLTLFICFTFANTAYLGIPVLTQISGPEILPTVSLIIAVYSFWVFSIGIGYLDYTKEKNKKHAAKNILKNFFKNPLLLSVILGLVFSIVNIPIPEMALKALEMINASVTPIVLVVIGLFIGTSKLGKFRDWIPVIAFSILTLLILPAIFYFGVKALGYHASNFYASIIEAAMPLAISPFALAESYKLNKTFIARSIVLSTVLSAISLPFWISII